MYEPDNEHSKIEDIKRRLYDKDDHSVDVIHEGVLHEKTFNIRKDWDNISTIDKTTSIIMAKRKNSFFKKFFIGAILFFICAVGFALYMYFSGGVSVSNDNIDIKVLGNAFTKGGEELPLQIEITNRNNANLEFADLLIDYPKGANDDPTDVIRLPRDKIGTIKKGQSITRNIKVKLFGDEKSVRNVRISLEYHPEGSNAIFTKEKEYQVTISSAPISLRIEAPSQATSNQKISFSITAVLNTTLPSESTKLQIVYPSNFVYESATPEPALDNSIWSLDSLTQSNPITIKVEGSLIGQDGDEQVFHVYAGTSSGSNSSGVNVVYTSLLHPIMLAKPFLEARILVNGQDSPSYTANGGEVVNGEVTWVNNLSTQITNGQIILNLSGNAFDKTTVNTLEGFYDSANSRIIWDKNTVSALSEIEPGETGTVSFSFRPISLIGVTNIRDPQVVLDVSIKGNQPSLGEVFSDINNFAKKVVKLESDFQIAPSVSYASGSLPPKAETETKYTITWTLSNSANNVNQAIAKSVLPVYVSFVNSLQNPNENVSYNSNTREVIWNIGSVKQNTGSTSNREVSFVLSIKPSLSQVGSVPQLMKEINLSGTDSFTGTLIKNSRNPITTLIINDPSFKRGSERVVE